MRARDRSSGKLGRLKSQFTVLDYSPTVWVVRRKPGPPDRAWVYRPASDSFGSSFVLTRDEAARNIVGQELRADGRYVAFLLAPPIDDLSFPQVFSTTRVAPKPYATKCDSAATTLDLRTGQTSRTTTPQPDRGAPDADDVRQSKALALLDRHEIHFSREKPMEIAFSADGQRFLLRTEGSPAECSTSYSFSLGDFATETVTAVPVPDTLKSANDINIVSVTTP